MTSTDYKDPCIVAYPVQNHPQDSRVTIEEDANTIQTLNAKMGTGGGEHATDPHRSGCFQNTGIGWWKESETAECLRTPCGGDSTKSNLIVVKR